jgi:hypothetical protein
MSAFGGKADIADGHNEHAVTHGTVLGIFDRTQPMEAATKTTSLNVLMSCPRLLLRWNQAQRTSTGRQFFLRAD